MKCKFCNNETDGRRKRCGACNTKVRRYRAKIRVVHYLGGKCKNCGHVGPHYHYDVHHRDSSEKEFEFGKIANKSWDSIKIELAKCDLLCVYCHRKTHKDISLDFWNEILNYNGKDGEWLTPEVRESILKYALEDYGL